MRTVDWILGGVAAVFVVAVLVSSLDWRVELDTPIMLYQAFLMDRYGFVPYRDFFDMNMPGSYLAYFTIGKVFGYGDVGLRAADILLLLTLCTATGAMWWRLSRPAAVLAGSLVALRYLWFGQLMTLQREFLLLVAVALGTAAAVSTLPLVRRSLLAGLAFGVAMTIKPHAAIGLVPLVAYLAAEALAEPDHPRRQLLRGLAAGTVGVALPLVTALVWMLAQGIVDDFLHTLEYLPYYGALNRKHHVIEPTERLGYLLSELWRLGGYRWLWAFAVASVGWAWFTADLDDARRRILLLFGGMLAVFTVYPTASGQFWNYHWLPMNVWIAVCTPAFLVAQPAGAHLWRSIVPRLAVLGFVLFVTRASKGFDNPYFELARAPRNGLPDEIAALIEDELQEGDTVQGIGWAGDGITHAMLLTEARLATPYVYAFHFYHHVSTRYVRRLRKDFLRKFDKARPEIVVVAKPARWWVSGSDTTQRFPGLERRLERHYVVQEEARRYRFLVRKDRVGQPVDD